MLISEFDYKLPPELIAQEPLAARANSRMLAVNRSQQNWQDAQFQNFSEFINPGDVLVLNNTKVFPARLVGNRENLTGKIELFLVRELSSKIWETLARPARRLTEGTNLTFGNGKLKAKVLQKQPNGHIIVEFEANGDLAEVLETVGQTPLPPYIHREGKPTSADDTRYQTVYAQKKGAIAAPTAGLHFTPEILDQVRARGAEIVEITLHVGYGTFEPVRATHSSAHSVAPERSEISQPAADQLNRAKMDKRKIVSVGTTTTRALESATGDSGEIAYGALESALTITPGYKFKTVNALLTNFHLPQSSLLILVSAFAGHKLIMSAYAHAVAQKYRFYSYGDCMLID